MNACEPKDQTIFRVAQRDLPYTPIGNNTLQDWSLSFEAQGMLTRILSLPRNWSFRASWFFRKSGCGRNRGYRLLNVLIESNYAQRIAHRRKDGTILYWSYVFTDVPGDFGCVTDQLPLFGEVDEKSLARRKPTPLPQNGEVVKPVGKTTVVAGGRPLPQNQEMDNQDLDIGDTTKERTTQTNNRTKKSSVRASARLGLFQSQNDEGKDGSMALTPSADAIARGMQIAVGWDKAHLLEQFREMNDDVDVRNVDAAWIGFCKHVGPNSDKPAFRSTGAKQAGTDECPSDQIRIFRLGAEWQAWINHLDKVDRPLADRMRSQSTFMAYVPSPLPLHPTDRPTFPRAKAET